MQERYAVVRLTIEEFTRPVRTPQKTFSPYGDSDEESDCSPPTPTNTKATENKIDDSLRIFIEALPHLETLHYGFKYQALGRNGYCVCALATCLSPWRKKHHVNNDYSSCLSRRFRGQGLLQHCHDKGDDYHSATFYYLTNLFNNKSRSAQTALHHGINDQLRLTAEENSGRYFHNIDSQESNHLNQVNKRLIVNTGDNVGRKVHLRFLVKKYQVNVLTRMMDSV
jgi:hypothetical protein